jgi:hypothetical protein
LPRLDFCFHFFHSFFPINLSHPGFGRATAVLGKGAFSRPFGLEGFDVCYVDGVFELLDAGDFKRPSIVLAHDVLGFFGIPISVRVGGGFKLVSFDKKRLFHIYVPLWTPLYYIVCMTLQHKYKKIIKKLEKSSDGD